MSKTQLRVVDSEQAHNLDIARERIAQFRLDRERGEKPLPVATDHDIYGAPLLDRDAVVRASYPNYARHWEKKRRLARFKRALRERLLRWR